MKGGRGVEGSGSADIISDFHIGRAWRTTVCSNTSFSFSLRYLLYFAAVACCALRAAHFGARFGGLEPP